jgi:hypothetical protein
LLDHQCLLQGVVARRPPGGRFIKKIVVVLMIITPPEPRYVRGEVERSCSWDAG